MKTFDSYQEWERHYRSVRDLINGEDLRLGCYEPLSKISFPIIVHDGFECVGAMVFFTRDVNCHLHDGGSFKMNVGNRKNVFKNSSTDIDMNIRIYVERLLGQYYPVSEKFIEFEIDPSINTGIAELDLENADFEIEGGSYNLAFLLNTLLDPIKDALLPSIALTGKLAQTNGGHFLIGSVENIQEKLYAVASYNIDKFFVPLENTIELKRYKNSNGRYSISKNGSKMDIIPVEKPVDVLESIFGPKWYSLNIFRKCYDLKFMLKQEILTSNYVKIKNTLGRGNKPYVDISYYVNANIREESEDNKDTNLNKTQKGSSDSKKNETENHIQEKQTLINSRIIEDIGNGKAEKNIVLIGEAGSGKSTILRRLFYDLCKGEYDCVEHFLPIFIELKLLKESGKDFIDTLIECFLNHRETENGFIDFSHRDIYSKYIKALYEDARVLFLLDAYDEMMIPDQFFKMGSISNAIITSRYISNAIITSRDNDRENKDEKNIYIVQPLHSESIKEYIHNYMKDGDNSERLIEFLGKNKDAGIEHLLENPLMLSLIIRIISSTGTILTIEDTNKNRLISRATELLTEKIKNQKHFVEEFTGMTPYEFAIHFYTEVARQSFYEAKNRKNYESEPKHISIDRILRKLVLESKKNNLGQKLDDIINQLMKIFTVGTGIIEYSGNDEYRFFHQVFYEHFMAKYLAKNIGTIDAQDVLKKIIPIHKWRDVILFIADDLNDENVFFKIFLEAIDEYVISNDLSRFLSIIENVSISTKIDTEASELHVKVGAIASIYEVAYAILETGMINPRGYNGGLRHAIDKLLMVQTIVNAGLACDIPCTTDEPSSHTFDKKIHGFFSIDRNHPNRINFDRVLINAAHAAVKNDYSLFESNFKKVLSFLNKLGNTQIAAIFYFEKIFLKGNVNNHDLIDFGNKLGSYFANYCPIKDYYFVIKYENVIKNYLEMTTLFLECVKICKVSNAEKLKRRLFISPQQQEETSEIFKGNVFDENLPYLHQGNKNQDGS